MAYIALTGAYSLNGNGRLNVGGAITYDATTHAATYTAPPSSENFGGELGGFKSGSISFDASSVDNSTRGEGGWAVNSPGSRSATIELTWNKLETDAGQDALVDMITFSQSDWQNKGIAIAYLSSDGAATSPEESGFCGVFVPTSYSETQSGGGDNDATAVECSMTLVSYREISSINGIA